MSSLILNGWAASADAWSLCGVDRSAVYSYRDHLSGVTRRAFENAGSVRLAGWSMGGTHALELVLSAPEKVQSLLLVAATPRMMKDGDGWPGMTERRIQALSYGLRLSVRETLLPVNPYIVDDEESLSAGLDYLRKTDLRERLIAKRDELSRIPVTIFQSERDAVVPSAHARFLADVFASSRLVMVPGSEHALTVTEHLAIADELKISFAPRPSNLTNH